MKKIILILDKLRQHGTEIARQISSIIFCQIDKIDAAILTYFKEILAKMTENLPKDGVQSRQAVFVRCCLKVFYRISIRIPDKSTAPKCTYASGQYFVYSVIP